MGTVPIPKGAETQMNSCGALLHYTGMSPRGEPSITSGSRSLTRTVTQLPGCTRAKHLLYCHRLLVSSRRASSKIPAMLRSEIYVAIIKSTQENINDSHYAPHNVSNANQYAVKCSVISHVEPKEASVLEKTASQFIFS